MTTTTTAAARSATHDEDRGGFSLSTLRAKHAAKMARYGTTTTGSAYLVLDVLANYADPYGVAFPKRAKLFEAVGVGTRTGQRAIATLKASGVLVTVPMNWGGRSRHGFLLRGVDAPAKLADIIEAMRASSDGADLKARLARLPSKTAPVVSLVPESGTSWSARTAPQEAPTPSSDQGRKNEINFSRSGSGSRSGSTRARDAAPEEKLDPKLEEPETKPEKPKTNGTNVVAFRRPPSASLAAFFVATFEKATGRTLAEHERRDVSRALMNVPRSADRAAQEQEITDAIAGAMDRSEAPLRLGFLGRREDWIENLQRGRLLAPQAVEVPWIGDDADDAPIDVPTPTAVDPTPAELAELAEARAEFRALAPPPQAPAVARVDAPQTREPTRGGPPLPGFSPRPPRVHSERENYFASMFPAAAAAFTAREKGDPKS